ncbi:CinA family protein [Tsukamurella soli]|uniref:CinA C-terminal domain-containing protein n=1 Tax=Tsukamurella soli TaxID=644556 RepID=A0ABP8KGW2_9ACTN
MPATVGPGTVVALLKERAQTVATAESLTAGLLAATIADVPGASTVLRGGLIVYATDLKATLAGVPRELLDRCGPVHPDTARALAVGARERCDADWGVSLTGVAGPTVQDGVPVGTVYCGLACRAYDVAVRFEFDGDRSAVRAAAVAGALAELARAVRELSPEPGR